jgi:hypothetical protein
MKPFLFAALTAFLLMSSTRLSHAQEAGKDHVAADVDKDLFKKILGYWVVDFDSDVTKAMFATILAGKGEDKPTAEDIEDMKHQMGSTTFEIKDGLMIFHDSGESERARMTVKSQDLTTQTLVVESLSEGEEKPVEVTIVIDGDRISMGGKEEGGQMMKFGLKRIDKEAFEKRVAKAPVKDEPLPEVDNKPLDTKNGYPVATPIQDKPGFVLSPYNQHPVDVRDLPSGTLVMDPTYPPAEKKYFRVP